MNTCSVIEGVKYTRCGLQTEATQFDFKIKIVKLGKVLVLVQVFTSLPKNKNFGSLLKL